MTEAAAIFTRMLSSQQASTQEEKMMIDLLYNNNITLQMGDKRLNNISALTWNSNQCANIFALLEKSLNPEKYPWQTLHKAVLLLHTITLYGSEIAIDYCIQLFRTIDKLKIYNSATVKLGGLFASGGTDYGAPVREAAKELVNMLETDENIRQARQAARSEDILVPLGQDFLEMEAKSGGQSNAAAHEFGQGMDQTYLGAGFDLSQVPGMYENRPDRYFDDVNDPRRQTTVGDHQFTREAMNKDSLLDLVFNDEGNDQSEVTSFPESTDFLPAIEKQKQLEKQLAEQQEQLQRLQMLQQQQQQLQLQQQQQMNPSQLMGQMIHGIPQGQQSSHMMQASMHNQPMSQQYQQPNVFSNFQQHQMNYQSQNLGLQQTPQQQDMMQASQQNFQTQMMGHPQSMNNAQGNQQHQQQYQQQYQQQQSLYGLQQGQHNNIPGME